MSKLALAWCSVAFGQISVVSVADLRVPIPSLGRGEITSIVLRSPTPLADEEVPSGQRWPESLGDVRILFSRYAFTDFGVAARIGSIRSERLPLIGTAERFTFVRFQVPFSVFPNAGNIAFEILGGPWVMRTFVGSVQIDSRPVNVFGDHLVLEKCGESFYSRAAIFGDIDECRAQFFHEDGALAGPGRRAAPGTKLHVFSYGLGQTDPPTGDGDPFAEGAKVPILLRAWLEYRVNAAPRFAFADEVTVLSSTRASPVPGSVGLYRIDFEVPPTPAGVVLGECIASELGGVISNATVTIRGITSLTGGGLCITPNQRPDAPPRRFP